MCTTAEVARGATTFSSGALMNKERKEIFQLSRVTFKKVWEELRPFFDNKALFALTRAYI